MQPILVCLHGWGGSKESFDPLRDALKSVDLGVLTPDLPGFGKEPDPPAPWSVADYTDWTEAWIRAHVSAAEREGGIFLLGHSHGGRIALALAESQHLPIRHLFLCAAAGIRRPRHLKRLVGLTLAKGGKALLTLPGMRRLKPLCKKLLYRLVRVHDYERANEVMRETLRKVTAEDLRPLLSRITQPTDLFWGLEDGMTPIADGREMHAAIPGSRLHTYAGIRHAVHKDRAREIAEIIEGVLQDRSEGSTLSASSQP